jgi:predicted nucleic acid-binding protein
MNLVDSSAWLAYFADETNAGYFSEAVENNDLLLVPTICLYEVFKVVLREKGEDEALLALAAMQQGMVVDLTSELAIEAAAVGLEEKLPLADSIIFAVAKRHEAIIWTQDEHFAGKQNVRFKAKGR